MKLAILCLGLISALPAGLAARPHPGLFVRWSEGAAQIESKSGAGAAITPGEALSPGQAVSLSAGAKAHLLLGERVDVGLAGPARLRVRDLRTYREGGEHGWRARLSLESGCLWVDTRYNFATPLDLVLEFPGGVTLTAGPKTRWLAEAREGGVTFNTIGDAGAQAAVPDGQGGLKPSPGAAAAAAAGSPTAAAFQAVTPTPSAPSFPCPELAGMARAPVAVLVLSEDYDQDRRIRLRQAVVGPALMKSLAGLPGMTFVDQSGSTRIARLASAAFKYGGEGLARRVGRELNARWVLVANSTVKLKKVALGGGRHKKKREVLSSQAAARLLDVATGDVLAQDSANTRVAAGNWKERMEQTRQALQAASDKLGGYLAFEAANLVKGEPHPSHLISLSIQGIEVDQEVALRSALGRLDSVQRVFPRKFQKHFLELDVLLRAPRPELEKQMEGLRLKGAALRRLPDSASGGLEYALPTEP